MSRPWTRRVAGTHLAVWVVALGVFRVAVTPAERCPTVDVESIDRAVVAATGWAVRNVQPDGQFLYGYDRESDTVRDDYNLVRHAGLVDALYIAAGAPGSPVSADVVDAADVGLDYMIDNLVVHDDWVAVTAPGFAVKVGGTGLFVAALVHRRDLTGDTVHDDLIGRGARFLVAQQEANGAMRAFWSKSAQVPIDGRYSAFGTGEAMWALALADRVWPDGGFGAAARRTAAYIATQRRAHEDLVLRLPDHWTAYGFDELGGSADDDEAEYLRRLAGDFGLMTRYESQRTDAGINRLVRGPRALGAGVGALGEGLGALWRMSATEPALGSARDDLAERLLCTAGLLVDRQAGPGDVPDGAEADKVQGAWFRFDRTLMDDQQHTISALVAARAVLDAEGATP